MMVDFTKKKNHVVVFKVEDVLRIILAINLIIGGCYRFDEGTLLKIKNKCLRL
jgi:hypothetical protein